MIPWTKHEHKNQVSEKPKRHPQTRSQHSSPSLEVRASKSFVVDDFALSHFEKVTNHKKKKQL